jgi:hypothetical protein
MESVNCRSALFRPVALASSFALTCSLPIRAEAPADRAWSVLQSGLQDKTIGERVIAVRMLGLLENDPKAPVWSAKMISDS